MNLVVTNVNVQKEHVVILIHQDASDLVELNVTKMRIVPVNWLVRILFVSIHAVLYPVAKGQLAFQNGKRLTNIYKQKRSLVQKWVINKNFTTFT